MSLSSGASSSHIVVSCLSGCSARQQLLAALAKACRVSNTAAESKSAKSAESCIPAEPSTVVKVADLINLQTGNAATMAAVGAIQKWVLYRSLERTYAELCDCLIRVAVVLWQHQLHMIIQHPSGSHYKSPLYTATKDLKCKADIQLMDQSWVCGNPSCRVAEL